MKGFLEWFKSSTKMKRWMILILIGIVLACYGISEVIVMKELFFSEVAKIIAVFVLGFTSIVIGIICMQKRTLEVLIEASDSRMEKKKNINVKSLIFNKKIYAEGPNIVVIGGGSGLNTVLQGVKNYTNNITAIVTVSDYGKITTNSRQELDILPIDDIKESVIALSEDENTMEKLLNTKFEDGRLRGMCFGDIFFSAMKNVSEDFAKSIESTNKIFNITGKVLPVTLDEITICAELANGMVVEQKEKIPEVVYDKVTKINRIYINPSNCKAAPGVIEAIKQADSIIIGPGSLYTNVIPNLLVNGVAKAIKESKAIKVYVSNIMTEPGQTDNYSVSDHINAIIEHAGQGIIDYCIYDTGEVVPEYIKKYNMKGSDLVEQDIQGAKLKGVQLLKRNLSYIKDDNIRHNPNAIAEAVIELICEDLKFKDKKDDPQYLMLNSKLKYEKKINKQPKNKKKVNNNKKVRGKKQSKFKEKYGDRINSIRTSDMKNMQTKKIMQNNEVLETMKENLNNINKK